MTGDDNGFASYSDVYGPGGMADDRDDSNDPEFRDAAGYCGHGNYVGGSGADYMCGPCEDGISPAEWQRGIVMERTRATRDRAMRQAEMIARLLMLGVPSGDVVRIAEADNRFMLNPPSRYGRHYF